MGRASLKVRITVLTSLLVGLLWLLAVGMTWVEARHEAEELFDAHLVQSASLLIAQTSLTPEHDDEVFEDTHAPSLHRYGRRVAFQVWADHRLRLHSANAPSQPLSTVEEGLSDSLVEGERWRVFSAWNERRQVLVQVGERVAARDDLTHAVASGLLRPLLVALPVLALLIWLAVRQGVRPLELVASEVEARSPDNLAPLPNDKLPAEVIPLVERLNALFDRLARTFEQERRFTADAAHELRTPLAGLKAQAQVAQAATDDNGRQRALANLIRGCDRMAHTVEQLLVLARVDASRPADFVDMDLGSVARGIVGELAPQALNKGVEIELEADEAITLRGNPAWLAILVRNLVDNAVRYSPYGSLVKVAVSRSNDGVRLVVQDNGPGVPDQELPSLGRRFWRSHQLGQDTDGGDGSGLGLSIVGRIAELHGGKVQFQKNTSSTGHGLDVDVWLPRSTDTPFT